MKDLKDSNAIVKQIEEEFTEKMKSVISPFLDSAFSELINTNTENNLENPSQRKEELLDFLTAKSLRQRAISGFQIIANTLPLLTSEVRIKEIIEEWSKVPARCETLFSQNSTPSDFSKPPNSLQEAFEISDATIELFYRCGQTVFDQKRYSEASDVFFLLTFLATNRANIWIAYGLSAKNNQHLDEALTAFSAASLVDPKRPEPFLLSAKCYVEQKKFQDAREALQLAKEILHHSSEKNEKELKSYVDSEILKLGNRT